MRDRQDHSKCAGHSIPFFERGFYRKANRMGVCTMMAKSQLLWHAWTPPSPACTCPRRPMIGRRGRDVMSAEVVGQPERQADIVPRLRLDVRERRPEAEDIVAPLEPNGGAIELELGAQRSVAR